MRKGLLTFALALCMISLTGCADISQKIEEKMREESGMLNDASYIQYVDFSVNDQLDENNEYIVEEPVEEKKGAVRVSLATNNNLSVIYYLDEEHSNPVEGVAYLNQGDSIFATVDVGPKAYSSMYSFDSFRIHEYSVDGTRFVSDNLCGDFGKNGEIISIPMGYKGTEIAIEPLGKYSSKRILLNDYYVDDDDKEHDLDGKWLIDDEECMDSYIEISPVATYIISYSYDSSEFFFVSSTPECYYSNNDDGIIIFNQREALDDTEDYFVELHRYVSVSLVSDKERKVTVIKRGKAEEEKNVKVNTELTISQLKYGDRVTLKTNKEWSELGKNKELILIDSDYSRVTSNNGKAYEDEYTYTLVVPQKDGQFVFDPSEYSYEHGTIKFKCFDEEVNGVQYLAKDTKIYYEQESAEDGYWLSSENKYVIVGDDESTRKQLNAIHFTPKVQVTVSLPQPKYGGSVTYKSGGRRIDGDTLTTYSGAVISMDFDPWPGWKCDGIDGTEYIVGENKAQVITAKGKTIPDLFSEDSDHKPTLTVILNESLGADMKFKIAASGLTKNTEYSYNDKWYSKDYSAIDGEKIGTENNIEISISNKAIQSGKAIKILVEKTEKDSKKVVEEVRYIDDLTVAQKPFEIYSSGSNSYSDTYYSTIKMTISLVDIKKHVTITPASYTKLEVKNADTGECLSVGEMIQPDQRVTVTIYPIDGYYLTGKNVKDDKYESTMKYSKYLSDIKDIRDNHLAEKYVYITLGNNDLYANYTYLLDGQAVEGKIIAQKGQKLELVYEIVSDDYKLSKKAGGFIGIGASKKKITTSIIISADLDGKTVDKSSFGIETVKGE